MLGLAERLSSSPLITTLLIFVFLSNIFQYAKFNLFNSDRFNILVIGKSIREYNNTDNGNVKIDIIFMVSLTVSECNSLSFRYVNPVVYVSNKNCFFETNPSSLLATEEYKSPKLFTILRILAFTSCVLILFSIYVGSVKGVKNLFNDLNKYTYLFSSSEISPFLYNSIISFSEVKESPRTMGWASSISNPSNTDKSKSYNFFILFDTGINQ